MTAGGHILVGTTAVLAFLDGGLSACVIGVVIGGSVYWASNRHLSALPEKVLRVQKKALEDQLSALEGKGLSSEEAKQVKKDIAAKIETLTAKADHQQKYNKELSAMMALASFACPALGAVALVALTYDKWGYSVGEFTEALDQCLQPRDNDLKALYAEFA